MFEFDSRYYPDPMLRPGSPLKAEDFRPDDFRPGEKSVASAEIGGLMNPGQTAESISFDDFGPDEALKIPPEPGAELPTLSHLFQPFHFDPDAPSAVEDFKAIHTPPEVEEYPYEDLDTRAPEIVETLAGARQEARELLKAARAEAGELKQKAQAEAEAQVAEARRAEEEKQSVLRRELEQLRDELKQRLQEADDNWNEAENERRLARETQAGAEKREAEAAAATAEAKAERERCDEEHRARLEQLEASRDETLAQARAAGLEEGRRDGLAEGRESGRREALEEFRRRVDDFYALARKMENLYEDLWRANEPLMIQLALEAAGQIVNKELSQSKDLAEHAFKAAVSYLARAHRVTVLVRPQDIAQLEQAKAEQREKLGALVKVEFKGDETLGPGDLIIESDLGRLDATVAHRREQVLGALRKAFEEQYPPAAAPSAATAPAASEATGPAASAAEEEVSPEADLTPPNPADQSPPDNE